MRHRRERGASAEAQTVTATTGAINGVVTDSTKAVVPGVTVTLSGPSLMTTRTALTDEAGAYRFSAVPLGDHTLTFQLSGFGTIVREGIHVGLGFTATVNVELSPATVDDSVTVSGAAPVVDVSSTAVTTHFDSDKLASLPGARDFFAIAANTPGVALSKMDVGGNGALTLQEYTAYGLRATTGVNRNEVEGIRVGGANGANDNYLSDFASFCGDCHHGRGPDGGDAGAGHAGPVRQQVRRQRVSRQPVRGFPERRARSHQHRRQSDRARRVRRARPRRAGCQPAAALSGTSTRTWADT